MFLQCQSLPYSSIFSSKSIQIIEKSYEVFRIFCSAVQSLSKKNGIFFRSPRDSRSFDFIALIYFSVAYEIFIQSTDEGTENQRILWRLSTTIGIRRVTSCEAVKLGLMDSTVADDNCGSLPTTNHTRVWWHEVCHYCSLLFSLDH